MRDQEHAASIAEDWFGAVGILPGHDSSRRALERHILDALAAVRLEERRAIGAWIRTDARHAPSLVAMGAISLAEEIEQGLYLAGGTDQDGGAPRNWLEQSD